MTERKPWEFTSAMLHILAMFLMLCDHTWHALLPNWGWLTCIGRIAFPIFAFMIVEGYSHTHNFKKYLTRMLCFALVSEIPFDLMYSGTPVYPFHNNVMWTFLIALIGMKIMDVVKAKGKIWLAIIVMAIVSIVSYIIGYAAFVDYYGAGILMVYTFYIFRGNKWWNYVGQFACMAYINIVMLAGFYYDITIFGMHFEFVQQSLALLAFIPIWLYRGKQGYHSKPFQYFCYGFYPLHMLILVGLGYMLV